MLCYKSEHKNIWIKHLQTATKLPFHLLHFLVCRKCAYVHTCNGHNCVCVLMCSHVHGCQHKFGCVWDRLCVSVSNARPSESLVGWELGKEQWSMKLTEVPLWSNVTIMIAFLGTKLPSGSPTHSFLLSPNATSSSHPHPISAALFSHMQPELQLILQTQQQNRSMFAMHAKTLFTTGNRPFSQKYFTSQGFHNSNCFWNKTKGPFCSALKMSRGDVMTFIIIILGAFTPALLSV